MNDIEKAISYVQNMNLSVFVNKDEASEAIELITSILQHQLTNGWIPVSERLPESIGETVLLTVQNNRGISHEYGSVDIAYMRDDKRRIFHGTDGEYSFDDVIAWQPLPEPYKEAQ